MSYDKIYKDNIVSGASIRDGKGNRIDTNYAYLDSNKKVPVTLLPKIAVTVPSVVTGLYITKVSDTTFRVGGGYCTDSKNTTVLSLDNGITKTISVFAEGNGNGSLSAISGDLIPKMSSATAPGLITSDTTKFPHCAFNKDTGDCSSAYPNNGYIGYAFPYIVPPGTYQIYCRQTGAYSGTKTIKVNIIGTDGSEETILSSSFDSNKAYTIFNNVEVTINKSFTAIKFVMTGGPTIQEATIKAPTSSEYTVNLIAKEDGTTDVCLGNRIPDGFVYSRNIGKIILNDTATAIETYFPKVDLATLYSNNEIALKSELPVIPTNISELNNDAGYITNAVDNLVNYTDTTSLNSLLTGKQDTLVNQENIKSVNNQSLLGSGNIDIDTLENVTYTELVELKTNGQLKKGLYYRITDYVTTTNGKTTNSAEPSRSAGHQFDIVIQAISENQLSEICTACLHEGDTYFVNDNLSGWQIWYDINNDTSKYAWADDVNGKGVIYRLIDEKGNECQYDFKNIQFYRNPSSYTDIKTSLTASDGYYYTFSHYTSSTTVEDWTLGAVGTRLNAGNIIGDCVDTRYTYNINELKKLNNNILVLTNSGRDMSYNVLKFACINNTIIGEYIFSNTMQYGFTNNMCNSSFYCNFFVGIAGNNKFLAAFYENFVHLSFNKNTIKFMTLNVIFGMFFFQNTINGLFGLNNVGHICQNNTFSGRCTHNTFGNQVINNTFGNYFVYNSIGNYVSYNNFGAYNAMNNIGSSVSYIKTSSGNSTSAYGLKCAVINSGLTGSSSTNLLDLTALPTNTSYSITIQKDVNGKVLALWQDLGTTKGKYKESVTATNWNDIVPEYYTTTEIDTKLGDISSLLDSINGEVQ